MALDMLLNEFQQLKAGGIPIPDAAPAFPNFPVNPFDAPLGPMGQMGQMPPLGLRGLPESDMGLIANYGCWCYFQDKVGLGKGKPVDDLDKICRVLHEGYECIILDQDEIDEPCVPWEVTYNSAFGQGMAGLMGNQISKESLADECIFQNPKTSVHFFELSAN